MELLTENINLLKEQKTCIVCSDNEKEIVFIPCGHLCCCSVCSQPLNICPVCRQNIQQKFKTFNT